MRKLIRGFLDRYFHDEEAVIFTILLVVALVVLLTMGSILAPLLAAVVVSYLLQGLVNLLQRHNVHHLIAVTLVFLLFVGVFMAVLLLILPQVWLQFGRLINELPRLLVQAQGALQHLPEAYPDLVTQQQVQDLTRTLTADLAVFGQRMLSYSISSIPRFISWGVFLVLVPVLVFFMLKDKNKLVIWIEGLLPHNRPLMVQVWREMDLQLANYIRGKSLEILIVGVVSYLVLTLLGIGYTLLLSVLMGLSVVVPFIGVTVVAIPVALVAYVQWGVGGEFYWAMAAYFIIQLLDANVLVPIIFSETVNLHPVAILAAVLIFGGLWGLAGVFFAIPLATLIKAIISAWPDTARKPPSRPY